MDKMVKTISILELLKLFPTEHKAVKWLEKIRWNKTPICSHCGCCNNPTQSKTKKYAYWCRDCHNYFTVTTGTVMHGTKMPLQKWAVAVYYIVTARKGISSLQLSKELGITQKSSWFMLQRIRESFKQGDFIKLSRSVEVDETYIGGKEKNKHSNKKTKGTQGRSTLTKTAVIGARERNGKVTAKVITKTDSLTLKGFVHDNVQVGSTVYTDDHRGYIGLDGLFYKHESVKHSAREYVNGMAHTNGIESVWAVLKRGYNGTFHNISTKHLQRYVDEFAFRLNGGNVKIGTLDRMESFVSGIANKHLTYKELIA